MTTLLGGRYVSRLLRINKFPQELGELLGMGATGSVYKAKDMQQDGKVVAVKQILLSKMSKKQVADIMVTRILLFVDL